MNPRSLLLVLCHVLSTLRSCLSRKRNSGTSISTSWRNSNFIHQIHLAWQDHPEGLTANTDLLDLDGGNGAAQRAPLGEIDYTLDDEEPVEEEESSAPAEGAASSAPANTVVEGGEQEEEFQQVVRKRGSRGGKDLRKKEFNKYLHQVGVPIGCPSTPLSLAVHLSGLVLSIFKRPPTSPL